MHLAIKTLVLLITIIHLPTIGLCEEKSIHNFKFGLMEKKPSGEWYVYEEGDKFQLKKNGTCTYNNKKKDCMWRGVEFDYKFSSANTTLNCVVHTSHPMDFGNTKKVVAKKSKEMKFEIELQGKEGHKTIPGYTIYSSSFKDVTNTVKCYSEGSLLIDYQYTITGFSLIDWLKAIGKNNS